MLVLVSDLVIRVGSQAHDRRRRQRCGSGSALEERGAALRGIAARLGPSLSVSKPFGTIARSLEPEHSGYFSDFASILRLLDLPARSRILDVACGPGWLAEFLWRFGYDVTGIDICGELLDVARERIEKTAFVPWERDRGWIRFHQLDLETEHLDQRFDAILFYDCLHHFVDIDGVFRSIERMLAGGGLVLIKEGVMPAPGSPAEAALAAESCRSSTLESPFDHEWLIGFLRARGFDRVEGYIDVSVFFPRSVEARDAIAARFDAPPDANIILCQRGRKEFLARISVEEWVRDERGDLRLLVRVRNAGASPWRADPGLAVGSVSLGFRVEDPDGRVIEEHLARTPLPADLQPDEEIRVSVTYPLSAISLVVDPLLRIDMVLQGEFWFSEQGSPTVAQRLRSGDVATR